MVSIIGVVSSKIQHDKTDIVPRTLFAYTSKIKMISTKFIKG